ncbi:cation-translocating P-type ATPase [Priestia taiwanensis]|uniref:Carbonate dehydratase n=1 Tax=Priestia taiwanensis TaxID=1347902 RepID=A0A917AXY7_9BACI|nr:cation-translocating P-type ATPase [Priestia taiwanensis]MBM7364904.1 cation-transporting ATPase E [Priestia taiwanensis]GGE82734.1 carbonate dehydratase [Priestia taiwanensis]
MNNIHGLTEKEVEERVTKGQVNVLPKAPSRTTAQIIRANLFTSFNALNAILAIAVILAGSPKNALFAGVIITNTLIGIFQEVRAKATLEKLSVLNMAQVKVKRDGEERDISVESLVLDDVIILNPGTKIVADGEVMSLSEVEVDEALLTGEADPVFKEGGNPLYAGSFVVAGSGYAKVTKVGADTYAAKLAEEAKKFKLINSELQTAVNTLFKIIIWLVLPIGVLLVSTQLFFTNSSWQDAVVRAVTGIIGMVPEGLVLLTSATFVVAIIRLSKWNALVQELPATEVLARVDVLCLDKTGTITEGNLRLGEVETIGIYTKEQIDEVLAGIAHAFPVINPTQQAIVSTYTDPPALMITHKIPFSSDKKWMSVTFKERGAWVLGAPEVIIEKMDIAIRERIQQEAEKGRRVLLLAHVEREALMQHHFKNVCVGALLFIEDIIREEAPQALRYFAEEGVTIKVISGDNPVTVAAVAKKAGLVGAENYIDARTLPEEGEAFAELIHQYTVFGRVTPKQKKQMVIALQSKGHTVAMTGDGVNDVLALKEADCGIAMANGSDATKAVAQLVLLDSNFSTLPEVVAEGRRLINNLERVSELFLTKTTYSIMLSLLFGVFLLPFPLQPIQLTLIGTLAIGIPAFFLALRPNKDVVKSQFLKRILSLSIPNGVVLGFSTFAIYLMGRFFSLSLAEMGTLVVLVLGGGSLVVLARVARPYNMMNVSIVLGMITLFILACFFPFTRDWLDLRAVSNEYIVMALVFVLCTWPLIAFLQVSIRKYIR